jgi:hypothetical protein
MCFNAQVEATQVDWQEPQDVDTWVADAAVRDLSEWRAGYAVTLRNHIHHLRRVMRADGELHLDGAARKPRDSPQQR